MCQGNGPGADDLCDKHRTNLQRNGWSYMTMKQSYCDKKNKKRPSGEKLLSLAIQNTRDNVCLKYPQSILRSVAACVVYESSEEMLMWLEEAKFKKIKVAKGPSLFCIKPSTSAAAFWPSICVWTTLGC